jgi:two-component system cell cycle sensor histidine kinase/response regulator CckA
VPFTVFVVDDEVALCRLTCRMLRQAGFDCFWANTGEHALALLAERGEAPDLFIFEVRLPDMPGPTLAWLLSERYHDVPVLFVSDFHSFDATLLRAAPWDFLPKPYTVEDLLAAVRRVLTPPATQERTAG